MTDKVTIQIVLPWPAPGLSPNARLHWAKARKLKLPARATGKAKAEQATAGLPPYPAKGKLPVTITFHPPDRRHRDDDNMIGAFKSYRDGIADGIKVNDRRWQTTYQVREAVKGGMVVVELPVPAILSRSEREDGESGCHTPPEWLLRCEGP